MLIFKSLKSDGAVWWLQELLGDCRVCLGTVQVCSVTASPIPLPALCSPWSNLCSGGCRRSLRRQASPPSTRHLGRGPVHKPSSFQGWNRINKDIINLFTTWPARIHDVDCIQDFSALGHSIVSRDFQLIFGPHMKRQKQSKQFCKILDIHD